MTTMQKLPYELIEQVAHEAIHECRKAGFSPRLCVWEISPSILQTIRDHLSTITSATIPKDPHLDPPMKFLAITIRRGVRSEATGVRLRHVNTNKWE